MTHLQEEAISVSVIMPAYEEEQAIGKIVERVRKVMEQLGLSHEIIVVNDGSKDQTAQMALAAGARVCTHPYNMGNGAAVKTGIRHAMGDSIVLMDADGQHPPEEIPRLLEKLGPYDLVVGARSTGTKASMHRNFANAVYNQLASYVSDRKIEDLTSGFRAVKTPIAKEFVNILPNTFSYPTTLTLAVVRTGYSLVYVPFAAPAREGKSKIKIFRDGARFFLIILKIATLFAPLKIFLPASLLMFFTGMGYGLFKIFVLHTRYGPTSAMLMTVAVVVFLMGLISEQVTQLRFDQIGRVISSQKADDGK
ncbi:glycosyl transferase family 2 [Desulfatibacillum aliphaticivorans]|uniref:Glycosyl transferase family 2 n=1 Tax=Desulfatibacillum aliphaticivorans TaxID=218208 RepID=B8FD69_DESAL|nr:glycosyltransferase family 2 protein [Desulfatibacillum aliphaticivorans]ACL06500.1 glycosyl transferase family 2 [Desulfatibacillum aliphaticivorans]